MYQGIKFRIYPNKQQSILINKTLGCTRLIYNLGLDKRKAAIDNGIKCKYKDTSAMLTDIKGKDEYNFLNEVDSIALQQSLRDLDRAYNNYFSKLSDKPSKKKKHSNHQAYRAINQNNNIRIEDNHIKLPKLGLVKIKQSMPITSKIKSVTVSKTNTNKYFISLTTDKKEELLPNNGGVIGIDVGIKEFYCDSNGNTVYNPKYLESSQKKLKREQRKLSRKEKSNIKGYETKVITNKNGKQQTVRKPIYKIPLRECKNYQKQRMKLALVHEKITNQRNDFLHKQSTILVSENQTICIEDLNIKGMVKNHRLAQSISSVSWSKFFTMLEYKSRKYNTQIIKVPTFFPSSQTCSSCGYQNKKVKNLAIKEWRCPICNSIHNRDTNAAINILNKGLEY